MSRLYRHQKVRARWGILVFQNLRHWDLVPDSGCIDEGFGGGSGSGGGERYCRICLVEAVHKVTFVLPLSRRMSERILCARRSPTTPTCGVIVQQWLLMLLRLYEGYCDSQCAEVYAGVVRAFLWEFLWAFLKGSARGIVRMATLRTALVIVLAIIVASGVRDVVSLEP
ncbi:hypothetical protein F5H01DRAFT_359167 [Linnemannia elongata]|nr:hypothetical protein F5H01DRAFT_359167 [Linnemannia elongata]